MNFVKTLSDAIQNCIIPTVEKHKNDGLTIENYLPMAVKGKLLYIEDAEKVERGKGVKG